LTVLSVHLLLQKTDFTEQSFVLQQKPPKINSISNNFNS